MSGSCRIPDAKKSSNRAGEVELNHELQTTHERVKTYLTVCGKVVKFF